MVQIQVHPSGDLNLAPHLFNKTYAPFSFVNIHLPLTAKILGPVEEELVAMQSIPAQLDWILDTQSIIFQL